VQSIVIRGSNVVDSGRQTFRPAAGAEPTFTAQFHDLTITAHDALFGSRIGSSAVLTYPDGSSLTVALGPRHTTMLPQLPRGSYSLTVRAGVAIVAADVFTLSKDRTADVAVISSKDLSILGASLLTLALVLFAMGRHQLLRRRMARLRRSYRSDARLPALDEVLS